MSKRAKKISELPVSGDLISGKYLLEDCMSENEFTIVWRAVINGKQEPVALKFYPSEKAIDDFVLQLLTEELASHAIKHQHIIAPLGLGLFKRHPYLVIPFQKSGSLRDLMTRRNGSLMDETEVARIVQQVSNALIALHKKNLVHLDVTPENILIQEDGTFALTDYGSSRILHNTLMHEAGPNRILHPQYASPERYKSISSTPFDDIFSLGIIMFEMLQGKCPERDKSQNVDMKVFDELECSDSLSDIMARCLQQDVEARSSAVDLERWAKGFKPSKSRKQLLAERNKKKDQEAADHQEAERKAREEAERKAREEAERKAREEAERKAREEAERKAREEAERKAREEAERKAREEAERKAREEDETRGCDCFFMAI